MQGLLGQYNVNIITSGPVDFDVLNAYYGTSIPADAVHVDRPALPVYFSQAHIGDALRCSLHQRYCRKVSPNYDVLISGYNPCDFGRPAIHRVADFSWDAEIFNQYDSAPEKTQRLIHRDNYLRRTYLAVCQRIGRPSGRDLFSGEDILIANSRWTADILRKKYQCAGVRIVHPPAPGGFPDVPLAQRDKGFVCLGRVAPEKRIHEMIDIVGDLRKLGHTDAHLHVIGGVEDTAYGRMVMDMAEKRQSWVHLEGSRHGKEKRHLLASHRFALHGRRAEPFGIAVAEMVHAGCIAFVPNEGGPPEIVGDEPALCWDDHMDAVRKIDAVLRCEALQVELHQKMLARRSFYTVESYQQGIRDLVEEMLARVPREAR